MAGNIAAVAFKDPELIDPIVRVFYEAGQKMTAGQYINAMLEMHNRSHDRDVIAVRPKTLDFSPRRSYW